MRNTLITVVCLLVYLGLNAQTCIPAGTSLILSSQQEIDDFSTDYNGCTHLEGNLFIQDMAGDITNLDGLSGITTVDGYIYIRQNHVLTDITGLSNLTTIGDFIFLYFNELMTNLDGLSGLSSIPGFLYLSKMDGLVDLTGLNNVASIGEFVYINDNASLASLSALSNLSSIGGFLIARNNDVLTDFTGLEGLTSIPGLLNVANNASLTSFKGLDNITSIDSFAYILNNNALTSFTGLENLTTIKDYLYINDNVNVEDFNAFANLNTIGENLYIGNAPKITSMAGFENLASINGSLSIFNCDDLESIEALNGIDPATVNDLYIEQNNSLKICESDLVCTYLSSDSPSSFTGNHPACGTALTVENRCSGIYPLTEPDNDQCISLPSVEISNAVGNTNEDVHIFDLDCNLLCTINANGNDLGNVFFEVFLSSTTRYVAQSYINRDIAITPQHQPSSDVEVTLYYTAAEYAALQMADPSINSPFDIVTRKSPDFCSAGIDISYPYLQQKLSGFYGNNGDIYITVDVSSFSTFYQHGNDVLILPVELTEFTGKQNNTHIDLFWSTLTETDNDFFEIEHSSNAARDFYPIGTVKGANTTLEKQEYTFTHTKPQEGNNYYRLKQVDLNGEYINSPVIVVEHKMIRLGMYPNPAADQIVFGADQQSHIEIAIYNSVAKKVMDISSTTNANIDISELPKGIYHIVVINGLEQLEYRLIKM